MSNLPTPLITADDLLRLPEGDDMELVDGRPVMRMLGARAGWLSGQIAYQLTKFVDEYSGFVFGIGASYHCFPLESERVRKPSVSYIAPDRLEIHEIPAGHLTFAPDLVVDALSPFEPEDKTLRRLHDFLEVNVRLAWLVSPDESSIRVFRPNGKVSQLGRGDSLTGEDVIPGFHCRVADIFDKPNTP